MFSDRICAEETSSISNISKDKTVAITPKGKSTYPQLRKQGDGEKNVGYPNDNIEHNEAFKVVQGDKRLSRAFRA